MEQSLIQGLILKQYRASLAMLHQAIEICPDALWLAPEYRNRFWHVAYHAVFYTHFYVQPSEADFRPWAKHQPDSNFLGAPGAPDEAPKTLIPYTQADVLEYHALCCSQVEEKVRTTDLEAPSGFHWLPFNKLELQLYNIRHLQHHTGQLADRLRTKIDHGISWVRAR